jgi:hypothetical protein
MMKKQMMTQKDVEEMRDVVFHLPIDQSKPISLRNPTIGYILQLFRERKYKYNANRYKKGTKSKIVTSAFKLSLRKTGLITEEEHTALVHGSEEIFIEDKPRDQASPLSSQSEVNSSDGENSKAEIEPQSDLLEVDTLFPLDIPDNGDIENWLA